MRIDIHFSESIIDTLTGYGGSIVVFFLYWPFVFKLRQFGEGIVQAQEHFKYWNNKPRKNNEKISIHTGMYDFFEPQFIKYMNYDFLSCLFSSTLIAFPICFIMQFGGYIIIIREEIGELPFCYSYLILCCSFICNWFFNHSIDSILLHLWRHYYTID